MFLKAKEYLRMKNDRDKKFELEGIFCKTLRGVSRIFDCPFPGDDAAITSSVK